MKTILVTGAKGFIGKNLIANLRKNDNLYIIEYDINNTLKELENMLTEADFIFHLAAVMRPKDENDLIKVNVGLTKYITEFLRDSKKNTPILLSSSIQATQNNLYGISKKRAEDALIKYNKEIGARIYLFRLPNIFGRWCKPNYTSVVATFCYNISHDLEIRIDNENSQIGLAYIDDVIKIFVSLIEKDRSDIDSSFYYNIDVIFKTTVGELVQKIYELKDIQSISELSNTNDKFVKYLYITYLSYLDTN